MVYKEIYEFCKIRNKGTSIYNNGEYTPRMEFLIELLEKNNIEYEVDEYVVDTNYTLYNIYLKGSSDKWLMAHHDVSNCDIDNANDNSASVINAISAKILMPEINVALTDGEEIGGYGAKRFVEKVENKELDVSFVLNLELTGIGGKNFFIGKYFSDLSKKIIEKFDCERFNTPFNDSDILFQHNIDTTVINPLPLKDGIEDSDKCSQVKEMDLSVLPRCHTEEDTVDKISIEDMKIFTEEVLLEILK